MVPWHQFSCYITIANSVGDSSRFRGVYKLTMIKFLEVSDRCFCCGISSIHLTPPPCVRHALNSHMDPYSSTTLCGTCLTCLTMSHLLMELLTFQACLGSDTCPAFVDNQIRGAHISGLKEERLHMTFQVSSHLPCSCQVQVASSFEGHFTDTPLPCQALNPLFCSPSIHIPFMLLPLVVY